jgi:membrane associated rhomboid family serine protease
MNYISKKLGPVITLLTVMWLVEAVNLVMGHGLTSWGILPRSLGGLIGIPLAPFIHAGLWHAISNTVPIFILGGLMLLSGKERFWRITVSIILLGGILVWLFARSSHHVGASGLALGYFGALLTRAVIERSIASIAIAVVTVTLYGGLLLGVLPLRSYISFESHIFGLLAGIAVVWLAARRRAKPGAGPYGP